MKEYNVNYKVNQEVYILTNKKIYKTHIDKIRVTEQHPFNEFVNIITGETRKSNGIEIDYLIMDEETPFGDRNNTRRSYDWYNQKDVFENKDELIKNIV